MASNYAYKVAILSTGLFWWQSSVQNWLWSALRVNYNCIQTLWVATTNCYSDKERKPLQLCPQWQWCVVTIRDNLIFPPQALLKSILLFCSTHRLQNTEKCKLMSSLEFVKEQRILWFDGSTNKWIANGINKQNYIYIYK